MKKIILFLISTVCAIPVIASTITGKVVNAQTHSPMGFVDVILLEPNNKKPLKKVFSDDKGEFVMPVAKEGKYTLKFSLLGFKSVKLTVTVGEDSQDVGVIQLAEKNEQLSEVEVIGQGSQMHFDIDKKVFSVDKNIASSGGSITDVLKNIPSVDVDVEGNISLRNDNNVEVWINGKPSGLTAANRAQILEQMPADDVKNIEIITNPSAKYSASGTAGIINLVMKENRKPGYYGGVMSGITRAGGGKIGGLAGANFSYADKKFDVYANAGYRDVVKQGTGWTDRYRLKDQDTTKLRKDNTKSHENKSPFLRAGLDYHLNEKNTIGISGFGLLSTESSDNYIKYVKTLEANNSLLKKYSRENTQNGYHPTVHLSMDYQHDFKDKGSNIKASITYARHKSGGDHEYLEKDSVPYLSTSDLFQNSTNVTSHWNLKVDYTKQLSKKSKFEAGWHSKILKSLDQSYGLNKLSGDTIDSFFDRFDYMEQIHAGYATYSGKIKRLSFLTGLRGEYIAYQSTNNTATYSKTNSEQSYFQLFPSLFLSYSLPGKNELQLNVARRINRPSSSQINPFHDYSDANDIDYGNATLVPEYSAAMELNYIKYWNNHCVSASLYYKKIDNTIENVSFVSPSSSDIMENTYMNISRAVKGGMEFIVKDNLFRILDLTSALNVYYNKINASVYTDSDYGISTVVPAQDNVSWTGKVIANVMFSRSFQGQLIGEYASSKIVSQGKKSPNYSLDMGLRKTLLENNLALSFTLRDILNSDRKKTITSGTGFYEVSESIPHGRTLRLTVTYNFGNMKSKKRTELNKKQTDLPDMETEDNNE
jgi:Outer membrane receptor proteins, mostly Fe transport